MKKFFNLAAIALSLYACVSCATHVNNKTTGEKNMSVTVIYDLEMKTRDGATLYSDVYLPAPKGKFPLIVLRSPYNSNKRGYDDYCANFCKEGVGVLCQGVRGTAHSEGVFDVSRQECDDGEDFLNWIAEQDFCNGNIVTNGESYPGHTQWQVARHGHPVLKGITPHNGPYNFYPVAIRVNGGWGYTFAVSWAFGMRSKWLDKPITPEAAKAYPWHLPLETMDEATGLGVWPLWREWMNHPTEDEFWTGKGNAFADFDKIAAPAFITGGWFDAFLKTTLESFSRMRKEGSTEKVRKFTKCVMEPLDHDMRTHDIDYGENHLAGIIETRNKFMINLLKNPDADPLPDQPPMRFFVMGSNRWMDAEEWPLPQTKYTPIYLHGKVAANSVVGNGSLSFNAPQKDTAEINDTFDYNPLTPVPTKGGSNLGGLAGQQWQDEIEKRGDVLIYTSEPMTEDMDVIGNVSAVIYAATDGKDTDFTVKLCDVDENGRSINICDGLQRGRFLEGNDREVLLTPGKVYEYKVDLWATAWTFKKGHCIRVQVSSSNFPRFDRNLNTGAHLTKSAEIRIAHQTVCHSAEYPSRVILPVFPK